MQPHRFEKQLVFRTQRFSRVRNVRWFRSIFCVCILPGMLFWIEGAIVHVYHR